MDYTIKPDLIYDIDVDEEEFDRTWGQRLAAFDEEEFAQAMEHRREEFEDNKVDAVVDELSSMAAREGLAA